MPKLEPVIVALEAHSGPCPAATWRGDPVGLHVGEIGIPGNRPPRAHVSEAFHWSALIAAVAHLLLLAALYPLAAEAPQSGGAGRHLEAISVSLVPSNVLETKVDAPPSDAGGGTRSEISTAEGDPGAKPLDEETTPQPVQEPEPPKPAPEIADEALPVRTKPQPESAEATHGGATSRAVTDAPARTTAASASRGEIDRYAVRVREALARSKPAGSRRGGRVTVVFTIATDGKATNVRVTQSSAARSLAGAVQNAVARTAFPPPPAGMSDEQRTYVVPFNFR